jgi:hypothetical protein
MKQTNGRDQGRQSGGGERELEGRCCKKGVIAMAYAIVASACGTAMTEEDEQNKQERRSKQGFYAKRWIAIHFRGLYAKVCDPV